MIGHVVGTDLPLRKGYTQTFSSLPFENYKVVKIDNIYNGIFRHCKQLHIKLPAVGRVFLGRGTNQIDLLHFWNKISLNKKPWIAALEGAIFEFDFPSKRFESIAVKRLAANSCRMILPFSQHAYDEIDYFLSKDHSRYRDLIVKKMKVSHPVQEATILDYGEKQLDSSNITFTMVGDEFFRKGGEEILKVFDRLLQNSYSVQLNIVSRLTQEYSPFSGENIDLDECMRIMDKYPNNIFLTSNLSHDKVLSLFKNTHVGLLPSYSETYGYSVLEAQSAGCPVITTNVRAFPEINNQKVGWVINVKQDYLCDALMWTRREKERTSKVLQESLLQTIEGILSHPNEIRKKGTNALEQIKEAYNPCKRAMEMQDIYDLALER